MNNQLQTINANLAVAGSIDSMIRFASHLVKSGFLPAAVNTPEKAVAIILTGNELGIPPMQALRQINVIQGKPTMAAELMLGLAYSKIPGFLSEILETTADRCVVRMTRPNHQPYTHTFTFQDAANLGLTSKDNWKKQPAVMLRWRAISSALKMVAPDAIMGLYSPEEINPDVKVDYETGEVIEIPSSRHLQSVPVPESDPVPPPSSDPIAMAAEQNLKQNDYITEKQIQRMFAIMKANGVALDTLKKYLVSKFNIHHSNEVPKGKVYEEICALEWIKDFAAE